LSDVDLVEYYSNYFKGLALELSRRGTKLVLVKQIPEAGWNVPDRAFRMLREQDEGEVRTLRSVYEGRNNKVNQIFEPLKDVVNVIVLNPDFPLCDQNFCYHTEDKIPFYMDDDHLSKLGSKKVTEYILEELNFRKIKESRTSE
jgi:hypothetical protein